MTPGSVADVEARESSMLRSPLHLEREAAIAEDHAAAASRHGETNAAARWAVAATHMRRFAADLRRMR